MIDIEPIFFIIGMALIVGGCLVWLGEFIHSRSLRHQHHTQLQLLHNIPVGLCYELRGQISVNKTWCLMWDLSHKPHTWEQLIKHLGDEDKQKLVRHYAILKEKNIPFDIIIQRQKRSFHMRGRPFEDDAFVIWMTDVSRFQEKIDQLNQHCAILNQQTELLTKAWETFPFPTFIRSKDGKIIFANQAVNTSVADSTDCHWQNQTFQTTEAAFTLTYGQETRTEEEVKSLIREIISGHRRLCQELPCALCLFNAQGQIVACSPAFAKLWQLNPKWLDTHPDYENFWDTIQENGLLSRVMDFSKYKKQQRKQFSELTQTQEVFLYLPNGKIIRRLMIPFAQGGVALLDEEKTV